MSAEPITVLKIGSDERPSAFHPASISPLRKTVVSASPAHPGKNPGARTAWKVKWQQDAFQSGQLPISVAADSQWTAAASRDKRIIFIDGKGTRLPIAKGEGAALFLKADRLYALGDGLRAWNLKQIDKCLQLRVPGTYPFHRLIEESGQLILSGTMYGEHPHGGVISDSARIIRVSLPADLKADDFGFEQTHRLSNGLDIATSRMVLGSHASSAGYSFMMAVPGQIYLLDKTLAPGASYTADFEPLSISDSPDGRFYLTVKIKGQIRLWGITREGGHFLDEALPVIPGTMLSGGYARPVASNGVVAIPLRDRVLALDATNGKKIWEHLYSTQNKYWPGLSLTETGDIVFSDGPRLVAYRPSGQAYDLFVFPETVTTVPVFTASGELVVATEKSIYRLTH